MRKVEGYDRVRHWMGGIRALNRGFVTNFFLSPTRVDRLASEELLFVAEYEGCVLLLHRDSDFYHLYYFAAGFVGLEAGLTLFLEDRGATLPLVADVVGATRESNEPVAALFRRAGFSDYRRLHRMSRTEGLSERQMEDPGIEFAGPEQADQVHGLLTAYFDRYSEQIPSIGELADMAQAGRVLVTMSEGRVIGFVVFELHGMTSYLRYWFAHPAYRDRKVGSALLRRFFAESSTTKRQLFWVIDTNANAIARYRHYGFRDEAMTDDILVRNIGKQDRL